jgi:hypothetical protein
MGCVLHGPQQVNYMRDPSRTFLPESCFTRKKINKYECQRMQTDACYARACFLRPVVPPEVEVNVDVDATSCMQDRPEHVWANITRLKVPEPRKAGS